MIMVSPDFTIIDRPESRHASFALYQTLAATRETGKAVSIPLNGLSVAAVQSRYRQAMRTRGLAFRYRLSLDRASIAAWVEDPKAQTAKHGHEREYESRHPSLS